MLGCIPIGKQTSLYHSLVPQQALAALRPHPCPFCLTAGWCWPMLELALVPSAPGWTLRPGPCFMVCPGLLMDTVTSLWCWRPSLNPKGCGHQCIASKHCLRGLLHEKSRWPVSSWLAAGSGGLESALCYWCCLYSCSAPRPSCLKAAGPSGAVVSVQGLPWFCSSALTCRAPGSGPAQLLWHYWGPAEPVHLSGSCCLPFSPHPKQLSSEAPLMLASGGLSLFLRRSCFFLVKPCCIYCHVTICGSQKHKAPKKRKETVEFWMCPFSFIFFPPCSHHLHH